MLLGFYSPGYSGTIPTPHRERQIGCSNSYLARNCSFGDAEPPDDLIRRCTRLSPSAEEARFGPA